MPSLPDSGVELTPKVMRRTGSSTFSLGQGHRVLGIGQRVADLDLGEAGDHEEVAGDALRDLDSLQSPEAHAAG